MFCTSCGEKITDNAKFCIYCGAPQTHSQKISEESVETVQKAEKSQSVSGKSSKTVGLLVLQDEKNEEKLYASDLEEPIVIGRDVSACKMIIENDKSVSRKHCKFFRMNNRCYVEDLQSFNHTWLNGVEVTEPREIKRGDRLKLGGVDLIVLECDLGQ